MSSTCKLKTSAAILIGMEMSMDRVPQKQEVSLADNRAQIALATYAFKKEHADIQSPSRNDIMTAWTGAHAADYRKTLEMSPPEATLKLDDEEALAALYEKILAAHDAGTETAH